jgi:NADPH-dependent glutamate synthase beta subunit-like oxidoreductase
MRFSSAAALRRDLGIQAGVRRRRICRHRLVIERLLRPHRRIGKRVIVLGGSNTAMDCAAARAASAAKTSR